LVRAAISSALPPPSPWAGFSFRMASMIFSRACNRASVSAKARSRSASLFSSSAMAISRSADLASRARRAFSKASTCGPFSDGVPPQGGRDCEMIVLIDLRASALA